ncbi:hypothetical protein BEL04_16785 [Mucilaginibacter sp. PPCGB 2223]|uniref:serine hydrolase n=1 Tax=Mucilaginibacter sp. PPCGB 2223 TaxID=1886027 RepID=UPI00082453E2|nr:serine hydrolase [Mucilaginibacter sp. PPCGB 2223]OCX51673.1 hypothetical protein BEL04_16785 [Mucilaginibacter sp. PPCGB 2223]
MRIFVATFLLGFLLNQPAFAQNSITLSGKVISGDDGQPVPYANIGIPKRGVGTAANGVGDFVFTIPPAAATDSLQISSIGFETKTIAITDLVKPGHLASITLIKSNQQLKAVSIEYRDPIKIIQRAIDRIPENYINKPHVTRGFYREYTHNGAKALELSEAVFDVYNWGYGDNRENLLKLIKARDVKNQHDFHGLEVGQKPRSIFSDDIVKAINDNAIFGTEGRKRHIFDVVGIVDFKGSPAYEIDFNEKEGIKEVTFRGKVFIDTKTYAFLYFDYNTSPKGLTYVKIGDFAERMLMKLTGTQIALKSNRTQIGYQKMGDKWVLGRVVDDAAIYIKSPGFNYDFTAKLDFNYVVTSIDTTQIAPFDNKLSKNDGIENHDSNDGEEFWKDYNIILPDFNTEQVVVQINAINNQVNLKNKFEQREHELPKNPAIRIDSMLAYYHNNGQFNGTALVKYKGQVILSKSYGYADKENKLLANAQTTYRIGSTSKTFTSVIINQLANEGKIDLHAPVKSYIPWYVHGDVTIEQLLTHQSGIPEYFNNNDYKLQIISRSFSLKDMVTKFCSDSLEFKPGSSFEYSNSNFTLLALIAEQAGGKPFETLLQERIFTPAQMINTYFGMHNGASSHKATGYSDGTTKEPVYDVTNEYGAGGISSSAEDLLKYHDALQNDKLLPKPTKAEMLKPRVEFKDYNAWYDYGWMTDKNAFAASQKHVITYHPGTDLGFFTMYVRQEDTDSCIILLNNTGGFPRYDMTDIILSVLN